MYYDMLEGIPTFYYRIDNMHYMCTYSSLYAIIVFYMAVYFIEHC